MNFATTSEDLDAILRLCISIGMGAVFGAMCHVWRRCHPRGAAYEKDDFIVSTFLGGLVGTAGFVALWIAVIHIRHPGAAGVYLNFFEFIVAANLPFALVSAWLIGLLVYRSVKEGTNTPTPRT